MNAIAYWLFIVITYLFQTGTIHLPKEEKEIPFGVIDSAFLFDLKINNELVLIDTQNAYLYEIYYQYTDDTVYIHVDSVNFFIKKEGKFTAVVNNNDSAVYSIYNKVVVVE